MAESSEPRETGSGVAGKPGIAYDPESVGKTDLSGVPMGDQHPTNEGEGDDKDEIVADVNIPGPYPTGRGDPTGEPMSSEPEPTKETRDAGSLGDLVEGSGFPTGAAEAAGAGGAGAGGEPEPAEDADVGTGRRKGQGLPPGSVGKGQDTPQTPAT